MAYAEGHCEGCKELPENCVCAPPEYAQQLEVIRVVVRIDAKDREGDVNALDQENIYLEELIGHCPNYVTKESRKYAHRALDRLLDNMNRFHYNKTNRGPKGK